MSLSSWVKCIEICGSFSNNNGGEQSTTSIEIAQGLSYVGLRDLIGYEIYRNNELVRDLFRSSFWNSR